MALLFSSPLSSIPFPRGSGGDLFSLTSSISFLSSFEGDSSVLTVRSSSVTVAEETSAFVLVTPFGDSGLTNVVGSFSIILGLGSLSDGLSLLVVMATSVDWTSSSGDGNDSTVSLAGL